MRISKTNVVFYTCLSIILMRVFHIVQIDDFVVTIAVLAAAIIYFLTEVID